MMSDILSQTVADLDRYLSEAEWAGTYAGELRRPDRKVAK